MRRHADGATRPKPVVPYWILVAGWVAISAIALWYGGVRWTPSEVTVVSIVAALAIGVYIGEEGAKRKETPK